MNSILELTKRNPELQGCAADINQMAEIIIACYQNGGKLLLCGNGGSAADCTHIVGELMKGFIKRRPISPEVADSLLKKNPAMDKMLFQKLQGGLPAVNLCESQALLTAFCNDVDPDFLYAQQVFGLGKPGDVFWGLSTSGNAKNVNLAAQIAKAMGLTVLGMTGQNGGALKKNADVCVRVPAEKTYRVQELHLPVYHAVCAAVEEAFFTE